MFQRPIDFHWYVCNLSTISFLPCSTDIIPYGLFHGFAWCQFDHKEVCLVLMKLSNMTAGNS